jgi:hypothetical protein
VLDYTRIFCNLYTYILQFIHLYFAIYTCIFCNLYIYILQFIHVYFAIYTPIFWNLYNYILQFIHLLFCNLYTYILQFIHLYFAIYTPIFCNLHTYILQLIHLYCSYITSFRGLKLVELRAAVLYNFKLKSLLCFWNAFKTVAVEFSIDEFYFLSL